MISTLAPRVWDTRGARLCLRWGASVADRPLAYGQRATLPLPPIPPIFPLRKLNSVLAYGQRATLPLPPIPPIPEGEATPSQFVNLRAQPEFSRLRGGSSSPRVCPGGPPQIRTRRFPPSGSSASGGSRSAPYLHADARSWQRKCPQHLLEARPVDMASLTSSTQPCAPAPSQFVPQHR